ncbi:MAG: iron-siderophore ABC transporter substrate-binding protein [Nostoc sp. S4]|nr:iron-siderophore ABC transporter substrate-binding protein [Nostoc sp. S4]
MSVCACSNFHVKPKLLSVTPSSNTVRVVKHALGQTQIPIHPQRVVALDPVVLGTPLALGIKIVAAPKQFLKLLAPEDQPQDIKDIGFVPPNLEKILALKPDLILGSITFYQEIYPLLSHIAPTVLVNNKSIPNWKDIFIQLSDIMGKKQEAEQVLSHYYDRLRKFRTVMGKRLPQTQVSLLRLTPPNSIRFFTKEGFAGNILEDAGLARPASQNLDPQATLKKRGGGPIAYDLSNEVPQEADGDILFLIMSDPKNIDSQKTLQRLLSNPLWSRLKVVQQGKVYVVGDYWGCCASISANRVIDDLERYLIAD